MEVMSLAEFEQFVRAHQTWFRGPQPETQAAISSAECELGIKLPATLQWLLLNFGYWRGTGVAALPVVVAKTKAYHPEFPQNWVVLASELGTWETSNPATSLKERLIILETSRDFNEDGKNVIVCSTDGKIYQRYSCFSAYIYVRVTALSKRTLENYQTCPLWRTGKSAPLLTDGVNFDLQEFSRRLWETMLIHDVLRHSGHRAFPQKSFLPQRTQSRKIQTEVIKHTPVAQADVIPENIIRDQSHHHSLALEDPPVITFEVESPEEQMVISEVGEMVQERREYLKSQHVDVAILFEQRSSSPRQGSIFPDDLPAGKILLSPLSSHLSDTDSDHFQHESGRIVSLVELQTSSGSIRWVATWWLKEEAIPSWLESQAVILETQELLDRIPARLLTELLQNSRINKDCDDRARLH